MISVPLVALIWLGLRLTSPRILSAAARYVVWWVALAITIALPFAYVPAHPSVSVVRIAPAITEGTQLEPVSSFPSATSSKATAPSRFPLHITAGPWIAGISAAWVLAAFLFLLRLAVSCALLSGRKARARILSTTIDASTRRKIRMAVTDEVSAPMAAGFLRPTILVPTPFLGQLDPSELELIALHEAAHFARRDDYALILERIVEAVFVLHPTVRCIARQIDLEREIACDDRVVEATGRPRPYAACLTRVAELSGGLRGSFSAAAVTREGSHLTRRIEMLLDKTRRTGTRWLKTRLACALAVVSALAWMAARTPAVLAFTMPPPVTIAVPLASAAPIITGTKPPKPAPRLMAQAAPAPPPAAPQRPVEAASPSPAIFEDVQVTDPQDRIVSGLTRENFHIFEDDVEQQIYSFNEVSEPASLGVVSQYPDGITLPIQEDLVRLQQTIPVKIEFIETADPNLNVRDAARPAMDRIRREGHSMRRVILLFNDNQPVLGSIRRVGDTTTPQEKRALVFSYTESGVTVISLRGGTNNSMQGLARLRVLNGGSHYVLGYTPLNYSADGTFKYIRVKLSPPNGLPPLRLDFRPGYQATENPR
jgi:beta-lactamase regulating signal transducer with metallopeptidase domain